MQYPSLSIFSEYLTFHVHTPFPHFVPLYDLYYQPLLHLMRTQWNETEELILLLVRFFFCSLLLYIQSKPICFFSLGVAVHSSHSPPHFGSSINSLSFIFYYFFFFCFSVLLSIVLHIIIIRVLLFAFLNPLIQAGLPCRHSKTSRVSFSYVCVCVFSLFSRQYTWYTL